jgi:transformation/transcription domain-associated protein
MEALVAALSWPAFREAADLEVAQHHWNQPGESAAPVQQLRERIVKVFIRQLGSSHDRVVALATEGVQVTLKHNLLEKPVLQDGLRPILMDLAIWQRMTVHLLRHVHRLLDLLSSQFNVTLGAKLTEHLQKWMELDLHIHALQPHQGQPAWEPGTEWEVAASMLDIFHKLPPAAKDFLQSHEQRPGIVVLTIGLEEALQKLPGAAMPSRMWSPYRLPLTRFLNRYAKESVAYFLDDDSRLSKVEYFGRLLDVIRNPLGRPLLDCLAASTDQLLAVFARGSDAESDSLEAQLNCVHLISAMCKLMPSWLPRVVFEALLARWRSPARATRAASQNDDASRNLRMESKRLAQILVNFVRRHPEEYAVLFDLLTVFSSGQAVDFSALVTFLSLDIAREFNMATKRAILEHWIALYKSGALAHDDGVNAMRYLINPMVLWATTHSQQDLFAPGVVSSLVADVFRTPEAGAPAEQLQIEVIRLCSIVLQHTHALFDVHKKDLIQYVWWTLKQDNTAKAYAFLCVAHFFRAFPGVGEPVMLKAFVNMVRMSPVDAASRDAVRQAIDLMVPALQSLDSSVGGPEGEFRAPPHAPSCPRLARAPFAETCFHAPTAAAEAPIALPAGIAPMGSLDLSAILSGSGGRKLNYADELKKVMVEEGSLTLLVVLQMVVRNGELFYHSRSSFVNTMITSLNRLGLPSQATLENRILAVDLAATLYWWDRKAAEEESAAAMDIEEGAKEPPAEPPADAADEAPPANKPGRLTASDDETIINFLLRMAFVSCEVRDRDETGWRKLHSHCLDVLKDAARFRPPAPLKMHFFDRLLTQGMQQQMAQQQQQMQQGQVVVSEPSAHLMTGIRIANIFMVRPPCFVMHAACSPAMLPFSNACSLPPCSSPLAGVPAGEHHHVLSLPAGADDRARTLLQAPRARRDALDVHAAALQRVPRGPAYRPHSRAHGRARHGDPDPDARLRAAVEVPVAHRRGRKLLAGVLLVRLQLRRPDAGRDAGRPRLHAGRDGRAAQGDAPPGEGPQPAADALGAHCQDQHPARDAF